MRARSVTLTLCVGAFALAACSGEKRKSAIDKLREANELKLKFLNAKGAKSGRPERCHRSA